jgi:hypothetical protein
LADRLRRTMNPCERSCFARRQLVGARGGGPSPSPAPVCSTYPSESFCENGNVKIGNARDPVPDPIASTRLVHYPLSNFFWAKIYGGTGAHFLSWLRTAISQPLFRHVDKIVASLKTACSAAKRAGTIELGRFRSASSFLSSERYRNLYVMSPGQPS